MTRNGTTFTSVAFAAMLLCGTAFSADFNERFEGVKPAVSGFNGKLDFGYTYLDVDGTGSGNAFHGVGSLSAPITNDFGVQFDVGGAHLKGNNGGGSANAFGAGTHLFWRNPDVALLGAYAHYMRFNGGGSAVNDVRFGAEAEIYLDQVSIEGFAGADFVSSGGSDKTFASLDLVGAYYFNENFRLHAGISHEFDQTFGKIGGEAMLPFGSNNVALYADGSFSKDVTQISTGLRIYFGEAGKSLRARHREDDPKTRLTDLYKLTGLGGGATTPPAPLTPQEQCEADGGFWEETCGFCFTNNT